MIKRIKGTTDRLRMFDALPRALAPQRDLWPDIESRLTTMPNSREEYPEAGVNPWPAIAVGIAMAFVVGVILGTRFDGWPPPRDEPAAVNWTWLGAVKAVEKEYQTAFQTLLPLGQGELPLDEHSTREIERGWTELQFAELQLQSELRKDPDNPFLSQHWLKLREQQLRFMRQVAGIGQYHRREI